MTTLELNDEEREVLAAVLTDDLSDLRMEIADTENREFRERLEHKEEVMKGILAALGG